MNEAKANFEQFRADLHGFNYYYEDEISAGTTVILKMPPVSANKRSVNDIGWMIECENETDAQNVIVSGTLSSNPHNASAIWQEILADQDINKTLSGIKISNKSGSSCRVCVRVILC